jgi:UDP-glucose:(heptosyl)LPS alpha-1,3-glucosyltransferase
LRALAALGHARAQLFVIGRDKLGPYRRLADKLGVAHQVHFLGGRDDIPQWLWAADVLLHPAYAENTGTVLLEAAVAGLPVLTTDACGYAFWVRQAHMGTVLDADRVTDEALKQGLVEILAVDREHWVEQGRTFARTADIFDLVEHAVDCITGQEGA